MVSVGIGIVVETVLSTGIDYLFEDLLVRAHCLCFSSMPAFTLSSSSTYIAKTLACIFGTYFCSGVGNQVYHDFIAARGWSVQFTEINENKRCSILFHLLVPDGK